MKVRRALKLPDEFVLHSLRHTFLTRLGASGADAFVIRKTAGHFPVTVSERDKPGPLLTGRSRGEGSDTNDILAFDLVAGQEYTLRVGKPAQVEKTFKAAKDLTLEIELPAAKK